VVGGIYSPNHQTSRLVGLSVAWCTGQSGAHRTCPVRQPRHQSCWVPTVGALTAGPAWMSGGTSDMNCRVSGVPARAYLASARFWRALNAPAGDRWREVVVALLVHRTVRCTPDMSGELYRSKFPRLASSRTALPWGTGHCPVYTGQSGEL
jgi:hypothetical protein